MRSGFGGGITTRHYVHRRRWDFRFYEFMTSDGSLSPDGTRLWTKHFSGASPGSQTSKGLVDHNFDLLPTRFVRIFWKYWDTSCYSLQRLGEVGGASTIPGCGAGGTTDEIQIFGEGFPSEVDFRSPLIDLGAGKNLNSVEWSGDQPPGTRIEIRTRTGNEVLETYTYYDKNGKEVTERKYNKLIPSFKGPIDTTPCRGRRLECVESHLQLFGRGVSFALTASLPRNRRAHDFGFAVRGRFLSTIWPSISPNRSPAVLLGEIFPQQALPGVLTEFTYYLRPENASGFDRLAVESDTPVQFTSVAHNGTTLDAQMDTTAGGFLVHLPNRIRTDQLIRAEV